MKERTSRLTDGFFARHEAFGAIKTEILGACGLLLDAFRQGGNLRLHDFIVVLLWFHRNSPRFYQV